MRRVLQGLLLFVAGFAVANAAEDKPLVVELVDPYIEMHSGPGRGYPIFHVVDRGESVALGIAFPLCHDLLPDLAGENGS